MEIEKSGNSKVKLTIAVVAIIFAGTLFGALGYLLGSKNNDSVIKSEDQLMKDQDNNQNIEIKEEENKEGVDIKDEIADWKTYENAKLGVKFKYPSDFKIKTDEQKYEFSSGKNWYRIELENLSVIEKPYFIFEINPDGYGPFFPDKKYEISENSDGTINLVSEKEEKSDYSNDGIFLIVTNVIDFQSGDAYNSRFSFTEDGKNYENVYKSILKSVRIIKKDETVDWKTYENTGLGVQFKYPQEVEIVLEKENEIRINLPIISEQYVSEKYLLVNKKYTDGECSNPLFTRIGETEAITINSVDFVKETGGGAAAGSTYYSVSYSTLKNNWCTSLSFVVRSHSYKLDKNKEYAIFDQIISTFELIKSLNEAANLKVYNGNIINKNGKSFTFNYSLESWILNDNGHISNKKLSSCEFSPGGLFRQSMSNIVETKKMYFGNYEARKTKLGNDTDGVMRINVYFDIDLSSEFSLLLPENENDKQTCENDFDIILSTINFNN
jgi:hypothetical protein